MKSTYFRSPFFRKGWVSTLWLAAALVSLLSYAPMFAISVLAAPGDITITKSATPEPLSGIGGTTVVSVRLNGESCNTTVTGSDVIVIIDHSGSMYYDDALGAAKSAATTFVNLINPSRDQVAVVQFDDTVQLLQPLTSNTAAAKNAIGSIQLGGATNIGDAINVGQAELKSARAKANSSKVIILLTDGQSNTGPNEITAAANAKAGGSTIFTIGLGSGVNNPTLQTIASDLAYYYPSPTNVDLQQI